MPITFQPITPPGGTAPSPPAAAVPGDAHPAAPARRALNRRSVRYVVGRLLGAPSSIIGTVLLVAFALVALAAPVLAPCPAEQKTTCQQHPYKVPRYGFTTQPSPPSAEHPFGITPQRNDIYYGVVWGTRTAFKAGVTIIALALLIGLTIGSLAAYYGGWVEEILMRIVEIFQAFPYLLAALTLATILRSGGGAWLTDLFGRNSIAPAIIPLVAFGWMTYARLVRADILSVKERDYVMAARAVGASDASIIVRHILPNSIFPVLVVASLDIGTIVQSFAALAFFGLGVPKGYADWGQMIATARDVISTIHRDWYIVVYPGAALALFSLAWNLIGDTVRDILDPRYSQD